MEFTHKLMKTAEAISDEQHNYLESRIDYCGENEQAFDRRIESEAWLFFKLAELELKIQSLEIKH
jgi:hypothetical protein